MRTGSERSLKGKVSLNFRSGDECLNVYKPRTDSEVGIQESDTGVNRVRLV